MPELSDFRKRKDDFFRQSPQSPLSPQQQADFAGLRYFPENANLDLEVEVSPFSEQEMIQMQTTTGDVQTYERFGRFEI